MNIPTMIDPSLVADSVLDETKNMFQSQMNDYFHLYVPKTLREIYVWREQPSAEQQVHEFYGSYSRLNSENITRFLSYTGENARDFSAEEYLDSYEYFYDRFLDVIHITQHEGYESRYHPEGEPVADLLFEEFVFSLEHSPILSRLKKPYHKFKQVTDYGFELSEYLLNRIVTAASEKWEEAKTKQEALKLELEESARVRKGEESPITRTTLLREAAKQYSPGWIIDTIKNAPALMLADYFGLYAGLAAIPVGSYIGTFIADP